MFKLKKKKLIKIHSHSPLLSFVYLAKTDILTVHDGMYYQAKTSNHKFLFLYSLVERVVYCKVRMVHFISEFTKSKSLYPVAWKNSIIIYNTSHFESRYADLLPINILGINNKALKVLCVRSIEARARFDLLLEVAPLIVDCGVQFIVAGKGPLLTKYRTQVVEKDIKNITFLGYVTDETLIDLYHECDLVLVLAEFGEGFGLPIIEGYLFNKPVIASNVCAIPEVIIDQSFLTNNTTQEIVHKLKSFKNLPRLKFREYYDQNFSSHLILDMFRTLYQSIT
ncbi:MAG: glycosyltransferase family 4 protein [Pedobacter sp.]